MFEFAFAGGLEKLEEVALLFSAGGAGGPAKNDAAGNPSAEECWERPVKELEYDVMNEKVTFPSWPTP